MKPGQKPSTRIKEILVDKYGGSILELSFAIMDYLDERMRLDYPEPKE